MALLLVLLLPQRASDAPRLCRFLGSGEVELNIIDKKI